MPRFIDLYYEWMEGGKLPQDGLCNSLPRRLENFMVDNFCPSLEETKKLIDLRLSRAYWASQSKPFTDRSMFWLSPLRQNIMLLCAAMKNEL